MPFKFIVILLTALIWSICLSQDLTGNSGNSLTEKLLPQLCRDTDFNCIFSPFTIAQSLNFLLIGTDGLTRRQIKKVLNLTGISEEEISQHNLAYKTQLLDSNLHHDFFVHTLFCVDEEFPMNEIFEEEYQDQILVVNFQYPEETTDEINNIINQTTSGKIPKFLPVNVIASSNLSIFMNVMYFKGLWQYQFQNIRKQSFYLDIETEKMVDMMQINNIELSVGDFQDLSVGVVRLPFQFNYNKNPEMEMLIILPEFYPVENIYGVDALNLQRIIDNLSSIGAMQSLLDGQYVRKEILLSLPKFSVTYASRLGRVFEQLGVKEIFIPGSADFSPISNSSNLYTSEGFHETRIDIDEDGVDFVNNTSTGLIGRETIFLVNRPFLFALVHTRTNSVIVMGVISDPSKK
eukprot:TRINITY_DN23912_c0_g1_i1.p1 TRINITY_DN23912_c0_g1~~TRINITY_DN23912_c0_g1_i1.p1  ORF type:complete len:436 (+),score=27.02 TRINITY_DN23912_c0_g1_i1:95-1309(+)